MKTNKIIIICCCLLLAAFLLGAAGVIWLADAAAPESLDADRLIGVLITNEYLDLLDEEQFLNDHMGLLLEGGQISEAETAKYQGRLYADLKETPHTDEETGEFFVGKEYVFDGVDGIRLIAPRITDEAGSYSGNTVDEGISDASVSFLSTDTGEHISLKGTIYVASGSGLDCFYFNPVYQSPDGQVYVVSGHGVFWDSSEIPGASWTTKLSENREASTDDGAGSSSGTEVEVTVQLVGSPERTALLQFGGGHELLVKTDYQPGALPERLDILPDTAYILLETTSIEGVSRTLFQRADAYAYAFYCRDDGVCIKQSCQLGWDDPQ